MAMPDPDAAPIHLIRFGFRIAGLLGRAKLDALKASSITVSRAVLASARAHQDSEFEGVALRAARNAVDDDLDELVRWARLQLIGRGTQAEREAPYTNIFHSGIGHFTAAPLASQETRFKEFAALTIEHLPQNDPVRARVTEDLDRLLPEWVAARAALSDHNAARSVTRTRINASKDDWRRTMEKIYGGIVIERNKALADRFFKTPTRPNTPPQESPTPNEDLEEGLFDA